MELHTNVRVVSATLVFVRVRVCVCVIEKRMQHFLLVLKQSFTVNQIIML